MRIGFVKLAVIGVACALLVFLLWECYPGQLGLAPPTQQSQAISLAVNDGGQPQQSQTPVTAVRVEAVWSQYAIPGQLVEICWVKDPKAPHPHYERIIEKVRVRTHEGISAVDGEPADIITIGVTAEQAERLMRIGKIGWLRALAVPE